MLNVLLVEDNKLALEYLKTLINWESCGFKIVSTALDGEEGLKRYLKLRPQLIITDIQMPVMSGIDLVQRVRELDEDTKIIFLSSYQEFHYVRAAMNFGVSDYIIKHEIDEHSLVKKLTAMKALIYEGKIIKRLKFEKGIVENILGNSVVRKSDYELLHLDGFLYSLIALEQDHPVDVIKTILGKEFPLLEESDIKQACYGIGEEVSGVVHVKGNLYLLLISEQNSEKIINESAYELKTLSETNFGGTFSVFIIGEHMGFEECREKYKLYKEMINQRYFTKRSVVINSIFFESSKYSDEIQFDIDSIQNALKKENIDSILKFIDSSFIDIIKNRDYTNLSILSHKLMSILKGYDGKILNLKDGKYFTLFKEQDEDKFYTAKGISNFFRENYIELTDLLYKNKENEYSGAVRLAMEYIYKNYQNVNLSVENIVEHVGLSINKLSNIFKKETGYTLRGYLNWYRIEKSKELIGKGLRMYQIHKEVGYLTSQYFSKVFKKIVGLTPIEYKRGKGNEAII